MKIKRHTEIFFTSIRTAYKDIYDEELSPNYVVSDCCDAIFNMVQHDFNNSIIVNCYFHMVKSARNEHAKYLNDKSLKDQIYQKNYNKFHLQKTSRKHSFYSKKIFREKVNISCNLKNLIGMVSRNIGLVHVSKWVCHERTTLVKGTTNILKKNFLLGSWPLLRNFFKI